MEGNLKLLNVPDMLLIGLAAYVTITAMNRFLRYLSVPQLQA